MHHFPLCKMALHRFFHVMLFLLCLHTQTHASSTEEEQDNETTHRTRWAAFSPEQKNTHIEKLDLSNDANLSDLTFIHFFQHVKDLNLSDCSSLGDHYHPISKLTKLERLNIRGIGLKDAKPLASLVNLVSLTLSCDFSKAVKYIKRLPKLKELDLYCENPMDVVKVEQLPNLEKLRLAGVFNDYGQEPEGGLDFPSLKFLSSLVNLRALDLSSNDYIDSIKPIIKLPHLKRLNLSGSKSIRDLRRLAKVKSLVILDLRYTNAFYTPTLIEDLKAITTLPKLRKIKIDHDVDLPPLPEHVRVHIRH